MKRIMYVFNRLMNITGNLLGVQFTIIVLTTFIITISNADSREKFNFVDSFITLTTRKVGSKPISSKSSSNATPLLLHQHDEIYPIKTASPGFIARNNNNNNLEKSTLKSYSPVKSSSSATISPNEANVTTTTRAITTISAINNNQNHNLPKPLVLEDDIRDNKNPDNNINSGITNDNDEAHGKMNLEKVSRSNDTKSNYKDIKDEEDTKKSNTRRAMLTLLFIRSNLQTAARKGIDAMMKLYEKTEPEILRKGYVLGPNHPGTLLSKFSSPASNAAGIDQNVKAAFASLAATKAFQKSFKQQPPEEIGRQIKDDKVTFRHTPLEAFCPPRETPICLPAARRYRTHDGTCNNPRRPRWGSSQLPFNRFLPPAYSDGIEAVRRAKDDSPLSSARFVSLLVHGSREGDAPVTLMLAQWGQLIDHDLTSTVQPRPINGSVLQCCNTDNPHPNCLPIEVPSDDPWLAPLTIRCLEFLRSAPAHRRDCTLSWREQINQATSYIDASPIYSSNARTSDSARIFRRGLLIYGRGPANEDVCLRGAFSSHCIKPGDARSGEQPGLLALHHVWVGEHNRIAEELSELNPHWSDEKVYQEARRIIGAMFQHITYREFLPLVLGREVCRLFDLELENAGYFKGYNPKLNPTVANSFAAAAFRFGHSLIQGSYMRCDHNHNFLDNNVTLHEEFTRGDIGGPGSLHRIIRGMVSQNSLKRDEFITAELTNHLFQTGNFPFGLDLAAINIQRGRDHGIPPYNVWREPCGLSPVHSWEDLEHIVGPESAKRMSHAYRSVDDIDLFVGGIAERPVVGGIVGPTFACIIAQQFSNVRKGDRFWYENPGFENSFTPAQLHAIRKVSLAQVLCRAVGGGTLQPHVFLPHDVPGNRRTLCGVGILAPLDLRPWLEEDPFLKENTPITINNENGVNDAQTASVDKNDVLVLHDFGLTGNINITKIQDKLDFRHKKKPPLNKRPDMIANNRLDQEKKDQILSVQNEQLTSTTTIRTLMIENSTVSLQLNSQQKQGKQDITNEVVDEANDNVIANEVEGRSTPSLVIKNTNVLVDNFTENSETRQYNDDLDFNSHERPQKLVVDAPPPGQEYEIEINIRQTNKNKLPEKYETISFDNNYDRYDTYPSVSDYNTASTPFSYQPSQSYSNRPIYPPRQPPLPTAHHNYEHINEFGPQTKPPTIIYINEKDDFERYQVNNNQQGFFQNILSLGANTANNIINRFQRPFSTGGGGSSSSSSSSTSGISSSSSSSSTNVFGGSSSSSSSSSTPFGPTSSSSSSSSSGSSSSASSASTNGNFGFLSGAVTAANTGSSYSINIRPSVQPPFPQFPYGGGGPILGGSSRPPYAVPNRYGLISNSVRDPFSNSPFSPTKNSPANYRPRPSSPYSPPMRPNIYKDISEYDRYHSRGTHRPTIITDYQIKTKIDNLNHMMTLAKSEPIKSTTEQTIDIQKESDDTDDYDLDYYDENDINVTEISHLHLISDRTNMDTSQVKEAFDSLNKQQFTRPTSVTEENFNVDLNRLKQEFITTNNIAIKRPDIDDKTSFLDETIERHSNFTEEITAEDYDETPTDLNDSFAKHSVQTKKGNSNISFAQLNILTKPERPDKWVIFDAPLTTEDSLPEPPQIKSDLPTSEEFPKPIKVVKRKISENLLNETFTKRNHLENP